MPHGQPLTFCQHLNKEIEKERSRPASDNCTKCYVQLFPIWKQLDNQDIHLDWWCTKTNSPISSVGADLSCTSPIYRPSSADNLMSACNSQCTQYGKSTEKRHHMKVHIIYLFRGAEEYVRDSLSARESARDTLYFGYDLSLTSCTLISLFNPHII